MQVLEEAWQPSMTTSSLLLWIHDLTSLFTTSRASLLRKSLPWEHQIMQTSPLNSQHGVFSIFVKTLDVSLNILKMKFNTILDPKCLYVTTEHTKLNQSPLLYHCFPIIQMRFIYAEQDGVGKWVSSLGNSNQLVRTSQSPWLQWVLLQQSQKQRGVAWTLH